MNIVGSKAGAKAMLLRQLSSFFFLSDAEEAAEFRASCAEGAYATSESIEVPAVLAAHGEALYDLLEEVARAAVELP